MRSVAGGKRNDGCGDSCVHYTTAVDVITVNVNRAIVTADTPRGKERWRRGDHENPFCSIKIQIKSTKTPDDYRSRMANSNRPDEIAKQRPVFYFARANELNLKKKKTVIETPRWSGDAATIANKTAHLATVVTLGERPSSSPVRGLPPFRAASETAASALGARGSIIRRGTLLLRAVVKGVRRWYTSWFFWINAVYLLVIVKSGVM